jgi:hypothetical protein
MCPDPGPRYVGRYRGLGRPPALNGSVGRLAGFAYAPDQVIGLAFGCTLGPHIELHRNENKDECRLCFRYC